MNIFDTLVNIRKIAQNNGCSPAGLNKIDATISNFVADETFKDENCISKEHEIWNYIGIESFCTPEFWAES